MHKAPACDTAKIVAPTAVAYKQVAHGVRGDFTGSTWCYQAPNT